MTLSESDDRSVNKGAKKREMLIENYTKHKRSEKIYKEEKENKLVDLNSFSYYSRKASRKPPGFYSEANVTIKGMLFFNKRSNLIVEAFRLN